MTTQSYSMADGFTLTINDPNALLLGGADVSPLLKNVNYIISQLETYLVFAAPLDLQIDVKPQSENPGSAAFAAEPQFATQNGQDVFVAQVKAATGADLNGSAPDSAVIMYVGADGSILNYGAPIWFDPNPQAGVAPAVPNGDADFNVFIHELFHTFGFSSSPNDTAAWAQHIVLLNGVYYYGSPTIRALLGGDLPIVSNQDFYGAPGHYGNTDITDQPVTSGLMFEWGNYADNRIDIGQMDLLILQDLGWTIRNYQSSPLVDPIDSAAVTGTAGSDVLDAPKVSAIIAGGSGADRIVLPSGTGNGNYLIDGGDGIDTVVVGRIYSGFNLVKYNSDYLLQNKQGLDGVSLLRSIETVVFTDVTVTIDAAGTGKTVTATSLGAVVTYDGAASGYTLGLAGASVTVVDAAGDTDMLVGVQGIQFADHLVIVAAPPGQNAVTTGNVTELYAAVLAREPDVSGLSFYQSYLASNPATPMLQFAEWFLSSSEYTGNTAHNYAQTSAGDQQFIVDSYENLLGRAPSSDDVAFYQTKVLAPALAGLTPGSQAYHAAQLQAHARMLVYFSASAEFLHDVQITASDPAGAQHWLFLA